MSVNKVILLGNLTADPERRTTPSGAVVVKLRIATNERFKDREGKPQERSEFHKVTFWGRQAEVIDQYARKGSPLYIEGRIQTSEYNDRDGNRRWATEIVAREFQFVGGGRKRDGDERGGEGGGGGGGRGGYNDNTSGYGSAPSTQAATQAATQPSASAPVTGQGNSGQGEGGSRGGDSGKSQSGGDEESYPWGGGGPDDDLPF